MDEPHLLIESEADLVNQILQRIRTDNTDPKFQRLTHMVLTDIHLKQLIRSAIRHHDVILRVNHCIVFECPECDGRGEWETKPGEVYECDTCWTYGELHEGSDKNLYRKTQCPAKHKEKPDV